MTGDEFREIHDAWVELRTIYDEIDALHEEEKGRGIAASGPYGAPGATAQ